MKNFKSDSDFRLQAPGSEPENIRIPQVASKAPLLAGDETHTVPQIVVTAPSSFEGENSPAPPFNSTGPSLPHPEEIDSSQSTPEPRFMPPVIDSTLKPEVKDVPGGSGDSESDSDDTTDSEDEGRGPDKAPSMSSELLQALGVEDGQLAWLQAEGAAELASKLLTVSSNMV